MLKMLIFVICIATVFGLMYMGAKALVIPLAFIIGYWAILKPLFHFEIDWRG